MAMTSTMEHATRAGRLVVQAISLKCRCKTVRHARAPLVSDLRGPRDHEVRCYQCDSVLAIWLTSTGGN